MDFKFCPKCSAPRTTARCSCGFVFKNNKQVKKQYREVFTPNEDDVQYYEECRKQIIRRVYIFKALVIVPFALYIAYIYFFSVNTTLLPFMTVALIMMIFITPNTTLHRDHYYTLSSSMTRNGNHQCIFCGGRGIYRSTIYRTNITIARCTSCQRILFRE